LKVGLTGNMGSGKTTVSSIFNCLGIPVYHADEQAKKMYLREEVLAVVVELAGSDILDREGKLNKAALAEKVFANREMLRNLTDIIHPLVRDDFSKWLLQQASVPYVIHEAAIIFESGFRKEYDLVIHLSCPDEIAISRILKRDGIPVEKVKQRMKYQMDDQQKASLSDFVIINDNNTMIIPQVLAIHQKLSERKS